MLNAWSSRAGIVRGLTHDYRALLRDSIGPGRKQVNRAKLNAAAVWCSGWLALILFLCLLFTLPRSAYIVAPRSPT